MVIPIAPSTNCFRGPTDLKTSKPWPENDAYASKKSIQPKLKARPVVGGHAASKANYVSHPGERFNALNNPAKPSGRRQGLRSTVAFARSTFLPFFGSWILMRRSGDAAADFLALGSCQCRLTIFGIVKLRGCGGVSLGTCVASRTGSSTTGARTYAISSLSALVKVSCEAP